MIASPPVAGDDTPPACVGVQFIPFESGSARLTPPARQILDGYRALLAASKFPSQVELTGSADRVGSRSANLRLSRRRAEAVRDYLSVNGFPRARITIAAAGEDKPMVETADGVAERQNRYVYLFEHVAPEEMARRDAIWSRVGPPRIVC